MAPHSQRGKTRAQFQLMSTSHHRANREDRARHAHHVERDLHHQALSCATSHRASTVHLQRSAASADRTNGLAHAHQPSARHEVDRADVQVGTTVYHQERRITRFQRHH